MSYKVDYYTLEKMDDGRVGNMQQSNGYFFTDKKISEIQEAINKHLEPLKRIAVIIKMEDEYI